MSRQTATIMSSGISNHLFGSVNLNRLFHAGLTNIRPGTEEKSLYGPFCRNRPKGIL